MGTACYVSSASDTNIHNIICPSGVPTSNGELTKSELFDIINYLGPWPVANIGMALIDCQFLQVRNFNNNLEALVEVVDHVPQDKTKNQAEGQHCLPKRESHYNYDYYGIHQSKSCQALSVHAQPSNNT